MVHVPAGFVSTLVTYLTVLKLSIATHHDLSLRGLLALGVLATKGPVSFKELHQLLSIPKSALTGLVDFLAAEGVVERRQDQQDRRRWIVSLTPSGERLAQAMQEEESRLVEPALQGLSDEEQAAFLKAIKSLSRELLEAQGHREARQGGSE
ncbi:MAG: MarR family transcriptional regulator [Chloroflexi bacterium]|nr:MarR family transcriptional regulator [Chloroflexota bacterium]